MGVINIVKNSIIGGSGGGSGGNSHLYLHTIRYKSAKVIWNNFTNIMIYNNSSDKLGYTGLASWLYNNGFIDLLSLYSNVSGKVRNPSFTYVASSYQGQTNTGRFIFDIPAGVYSADGVNIVLVYSSATNSTYAEIAVKANPESEAGIIDELEQITQIM